MLEINLSASRLYTFVDTAFLHGRPPQEIARELCLGGSDLIQLRAKNSPQAEVRQMAEAILQVTRAANVPLVINDYIEVARDVGAEICHLGQEDFFRAGFKHVDELKTGSPGLKIGLSTHSPADAKRAIAAGADYIAIGPVYATNTKPEARPVTLEYVRWAASHVKIPWFVIGGINLGTLDEVLAAGARRICVVSAILNAPSIIRSCQNFKQRLLSAQAVG